MTKGLEFSQKVLKDESMMLFLKKQPGFPGCEQEAVLSDICSDGEPFNPSPRG